MVFDEYSLDVTGQWGFGCLQVPTPAGAVAKDSGKDSGVNSVDTIEPGGKLEFVGIVSQQQQQRGTSVLLLGARGVGKKTAAKALGFEVGRDGRRC